MKRGPYLPASPKESPAPPRRSFRFFESRSIGGSRRHEWRGPEPAPSLDIYFIKI
jgi:hypothetical protein